MAKRYSLDPVSAGLQQLFEGLSSIGKPPLNPLDLLNLYEKQLSNQRKQQEFNHKIQKFERENKSEKGWNSYINKSALPENIKQDLKDAFDNPTAIKHIIDSLTEEPGWIDRLTGSAKHPLAPGGQGIGGAAQLTPENQPLIQQSLQSQGASPEGAQQFVQNAEELNQEEPFNMLRGLLSSGTEFGTNFALNQLSRAYPAAALGTGISGALTGTNYLGKLLGAENNILPTYEELQKMNFGPTPEQSERLMGHYPENVRTYLEDKNKQNIFQALPTFGQVSEGIKEVGSDLGLPLKPKNSTERTMNHVAAIAGNIYNLDKAASKIDNVKELGKALGAAFGVNTAGKLVGKAAGEKYAPVGEIGSLMLYSAFPGTLSSLSNKLYNKVNKVATDATKAGHTIETPYYKSKFENIENRIASELSQDSKAFNQATNAAARVRNDLFTYANKEVNPDKISNSLSSLRGAYKSIPQEGKKYIQELIEMERDMLGKGLDKFKPGTSKDLNNATSLFRSNAQFFNKYKDIKSLATRFGIPGAVAWYTVGLKPYFAGLAGYTGIQYAKSLIENPHVQDLMKQLSKESVLNNATAAERIITKLDKESNKILEKIPEKDRQIILDYAKQQGFLKS